MCSIQGKSRAWGDTSKHESTLHARTCFTHATHKRTTLRTCPEPESDCAAEAAESVVVVVVALVDPPYFMRRAVAREDANRDVTVADGGRRPVECLLAAGPPATALALVLVSVVVVAGRGSELRTAPLLMLLPAAAVGLREGKCMGSRRAQKSAA